MYGVDALQKQCEKQGVEHRSLFDMTVEMESGRVRIPSSLPLHPQVVHHVKEWAAEKEIE